VSVPDDVFVARELEQRRQRANRRARLEADLRHRGVGEAIIERVLRLNYDPQPGVRLRGIHFVRHGDPRWAWGCISKGEVIRRHGRAAWEAMPRSLIHKQGRRSYVSRETVADSLWLVPANDPLRHMRRA
jgi:hypothetical protein